MRQFQDPSETLLPLQDPIAHENRKRWIELLAKIARGDQAALGALYQETSPFVFGLILRIVADRARGEEVLMEAYQQVWRQAALYDPKRYQPLNWILKIARGRALACLRAGQDRDERDGSPGEKPAEVHALPATETVALLSQHHRQVRAALASLTAAQREVIELAYDRGLSLSEIAARLELSPDAVQKHVRFAMMRLREFLRPALQEQL